MRRPCPPNLPHSAVQPIMNGQGLSEENRLRPKITQTLPNNLGDRKLRRISRTESDEEPVFGPVPYQWFCN